MSNAIAARLAALAAAQKAQGQDLNETKSGGGDFPVAEAGACRVRFIGYRELGVHTTEYQRKKKTKPRAEFVFELSGPKHPPIELDDGRKIPHIIRFEEVIGYTEKNGYMKLFAKMVQDKPGATTFFELLGEGYRATVVHPKPSKSGKIWPKLRNAEGYTIASKTYEDPETGEAKQVAVAPATQELSVFPWDFATVEDWDALFIDGRYDDGGTKNKIQEKIKRAENFVGSPIYIALMEAGREKDTELDPTYKEFGGGGGADKDDAEEEDESTEPKKAVQVPKTQGALSQAASEADPLAALD